MGEDGHDESAVEELLAESRGNRQGEIGKQLYGGLRQESFRDGLNGAPRSDRNSPHAPQVQPLESRRGRVKDEALHRGDLRKRQQFLHARPPAPRQDQAEHQEDYPSVPRHPRIRTLSTSAAQVSIVLLRASANGGTSL